MGIKHTIRMHWQKLHSKNKKTESQFVFGNKNSGSVFDPFVLPSESEKTSLMLFISLRKSGDIGVLKVAENQVKGECQIVLKADGCAWADQVNRPCVLDSEGTFLMYFTGQKNGISRIGLAKSRNGYEWELISKPVLCPETYVEGCSVMNPSVLFDKDEHIFKMWYSCGETYEPDAVCYAESKDGINWDKHSYNPVFIKSNNFYDNAKVSVGQVQKIGNVFLMLYIGYESVDHACICAAISPDGIRWNRLEDINPIITYGGKNSKDAVYRPTFLYDSFHKNISIWFNGRTKNLERILYTNVNFDLEKYCPVKVNTYEK